MTKINTFERLMFANNPLRAAGQRHYEARILRDFGGGLDGGRALEVGCGRGVGVRIILDKFDAGEVVGIDLDDEQVARARRRLHDLEPKVKVRQGDMTAIDEPDESFDGAFAFQVIHHTPYEQTVRDIARVLKPGGRFYFFEPVRKVLERGPNRVLLDHPDYGMFTGEEFVEAVEKAGLVVGDRRRDAFFGVWITGVGIKS